MYELTEKDKVLLLCAFEQDENELGYETCIVSLANECGKNYRETSERLLIKLGVKVINE